MLGRWFNNILLSGLLLGGLLLPQAGFGQLEGKYTRFFGVDGITITFQDSSFRYAYHHDLGNNAFGIGRHVIKNDTIWFSFFKHPDDIELKMKDFGYDTLAHAIALLKKSMIHYYPEGEVWKCLMEENSEERLVLRRIEDGELKQYLGVFRKIK